MYNSSSSSQETINLEHEIDTKSEKRGSFGDNLPGQVVSQDNSIDMESESDASSTEFDIEFFRKKTITQNVNTSLQKSQSRNRRNMQKHIKFLGIQFETAIILERNKDPILYLKSYFIICVLTDFAFIVLFIVGFNFAILPLLLSIVFIAFLSILEIFLCNTSVKNGADFKPKTIFLVFVLATLYLAFFVYSFLVQFPFNSVPLFILINYFFLLPGCLSGIFAITPNFTPYDDLNYQLKFFVVLVYQMLYLISFQEYSQFRNHLKSFQSLEFCYLFCVILIIFKQQREFQWLKKLVQQNNCVPSFLRRQL